MVLEQLSEALHGYRTPSEWIAALDGAAEKRQQKFAAGYHATTTPSHPMRLLHVTDTHLTSHDASEGFGRWFERTFT